MSARMIDLTEDDFRRIVREEIARARGEELLTVAQVAAELNKHPQTIRAWLKEGLPYELVGARKQVRRADLDAWKHRDLSPAHLRLLGSR